MRDTKSRNSIHGVVRCCNKLWGQGALPGDGGARHAALGARRADWRADDASREAGACRAHGPAGGSSGAPPAAELAKAPLTIGGKKRQPGEVPKTGELELGLLHTHRELC